MKRIKYIYNPQTCQYEPVYLTGKRLTRKLTVFFSISLGIAFLGFVWFINQFNSLEEQLLQNKNLELKTRWMVLQNSIDEANASLEEFIAKDDQNYRVILDLEPLG